MPPEKRGIQNFQDNQPKNTQKYIKNIVSLTPYKIVLF